MNTYVMTKEECEHKITGVCEGCGQPLSAIETVDNSNHPTYWQGCQSCSCFRQGVDPKHYRVAIRLMEIELEKDESACHDKVANLSRRIARIELLLKQEGA